MKDWQSISESPFYEKANTYVEETHNNDCTLEAFIDGAESRQAEIAELEAQIEKMKCCAKCAHCNTYITSCIPQKRFVRLEDVCEDFELRR